MLTLTGLPAHTSIDLNFLFAKIDSWDGTLTYSAPDYSPDWFNVKVDGRFLFSETFTDLPSNVAFQSYFPPAGVFLARGNFGFNTLNDNFIESAYNLGLDSRFNNIAHTSSTLTVEWFANGAGWEGGTNESWGIDNVEVIANGVSTPPPRPRFTINDVNIFEGNSGTTNARFTVTLIGRATNPVSVLYSTSNGTARANRDFIPKAGILTFRASNQTRQTQTITVPIRGDRTFENNETFFVSLSNAANADIQDSRGTGTIVNDDNRLAGSIDASLAEIMSHLGSSTSTNIPTATDQSLNFYLAATSLITPEALIV